MTPEEQEPEATEHYKKSHLAIQLQKDSTQREENPKWKDVIPACTGIVSLVGIALYGAARFAESSFYGYLGLTPEDIGLGPAETLGKVAGVFALFAAGVALATIWPALVPNNWWAFAAGALSALGCFIIASVLYPSITSNLLFLPIPIAASVVVVMLSSLGWTKRALVWLKGPHTATDLVIGATAIALFFTLAAYAGKHAAMKVHAGAGITRPSPYPWPSGSVGFFGFEVREVAISWKSTAIADMPLPSKVTYLGEHDGIYYLYTHDAHQLFKIPTSFVALSEPV